MQNVQIKKLVKDDYEKFHVLYVQVLYEAFPEFSKNVKKYLTTKFKTRKRFSTQIKLGAFLSDELIGYVFVDTPDAGVTKIDWLGVKKEYQHQGVGSLLIRHAEEESRRQGVHNLQLICDKHLVEFYIFNGYEVFGFDKEAYFGCDVYLMKKILQEPKEKYYLKQ